MIIIDSNVWIFAEDASADEHSRAVRGVEQAVKTGEFGINSIIASEVYHRLSYVAGAAEARKRLTDIMDSPAARWLVMPVETVRRALQLSEETRLKINDAMIARQALEEKASVLTDDLRDFRKVKGLKLIPLR